MSTLAEEVIDYLKGEMNRVHEDGYQRGKSEGGGSDNLKALIEDNKIIFDWSDVGITKIGDYAFYKKNFVEQFNLDNITEICDGAFYQTIINEKLVIHNNITNFGFDVFRGSTVQSIYVDCGSLTVNMPNNIFRECKQLSSVEFGENTTCIPYGAFLGCTSLTEIYLPSTIKQLGLYCFEQCPNLTTINIPSSIEVIKHEIFLSSTALEFVTIEDGFNATGLDLSPSTKYSVETIVSWFEALADRTGLSAYTLIIGSENLAKLTDEQIAIATSKNWTLA